MSTVRPVGEIIARAAQLARSFRGKGLPVVFVNVTGAAPGRTDAGPRNLSSFLVDWMELVPELERRPNDHLVRKERVGAFIGTSLHDYLRQSDVTQIFLTGGATSAGVQATARSAYDYGYNVALVVDAITVHGSYPRTGMGEATVEVVLPRN